MNTSLYPHDTWMNIAACKNEPPELFFPGPGTKGIMSEPYRICWTCPVQTPCLQYALSHRILHGIWGGQSENARKRMIRLQAKARLDQQQQAM